MAKDIRVGDRITLQWTVKKVLDDGDIVISHPLYQIPITISANEIPQEDVERQSPPKPARRPRS